MISRRAVLGVAAAVAAVVVAVLLTSEPVPEPMRAGRAAPAFSLPPLGDGPPLSLEALRGRVVLVNFWATWCRPCLEEMPAMQRLYDALAEEGFELLAISVDESRAEVAAFRDRLGLTFPILLDPDRRIANAYQAYRFPESFLIGRDGRILARYIGPREWDARAYEDHLRRLLREPGAEG